MNQAIPISSEEEDKKMGLQQSEVCLEISYWEIKGYKS